MYGEHHTVFFYRCSLISNRNRVQIEKKYLFQLFCRSQQAFSDKGGGQQSGASRSCPVRFRENGRFPALSWNRSQRASKRPKRAPEGLPGDPQSAPRDPQEAPKRRPEASKSARRGPGTAQESLKTVRENAKAAQESPHRPSRRARTVQEGHRTESSKRLPKCSPRAPTRPPRGPQRALDSSRGPSYAQDGRLTRQTSAAVQHGRVLPRS